MDSMEMDLDLDEVSQNNGSSEPALAVCWRRAEATPHCTWQQPKGKAEVVELLLAANAPVDVQNNGGRGPQFWHDSFGFY